MRLAKSLALILLGVVIGALSLRAASAQQATGSASIRMSAVSAERGFSFVKDARSGGCWIFYQYMPNLVALAPAPKEACD